MSRDTLSVKDNRTDRVYDLPVRRAAIQAADLRQIRVQDDAGLLSYDPALTNTATCQSGITFLDGEEGVLRYRGYPVEQLAERCNYLEVAYLLLRGELPTRAQFDEWKQAVMTHALLPESFGKLLDGFRRDAHPVGMFVSLVAALSTFYPEAKDVEAPQARQLQTIRLLGKMPTIAACAYRRNQGLPDIPPDGGLSYACNLMSMMFKSTGTSYRPDPVVERALDAMLILHADHEQNCSTHTMRSVGSSHADPYLCTAAAAAALSGPRHGGASVQVLRMLETIGSKRRAAEYVRRAKAGEVPLPGVGHRVYRNYDPRARVIRQVVAEVSAVTGGSPLLEVALELERIVLEDDYFVSRRLYPKIEFYSGLVYQALRLPAEMFPVLFAVARTGGWLAHWDEMLRDPEQQMTRPRQLYLGAGRREVAPIESRP